MLEEKPARAKYPVYFWFLLLFFTFTSAVTLIAGAEVVLRFLDYKERLTQFKKNQDLFEIAPFLQIRPRRNEEKHINSDSLRGDPIDTSKETFRIFTLGGSTTFSGELPYEKTYPGKLERKLREKYPNVKIQVQNAACDWYSTQHSIIRYLFKIRHFEPHLLIMKHGINDLFRGFTADCCSFPNSKFENNYSHYFGPIYRLAQIAETLPPPPFKLLVWEKSRRFIKRLTDHHPLSAELEEFISEQSAAVDEKDIRKFRSLSVFQTNLRLMARLAKLHKSQLIFLTQSSLYRKDLSEKELETLYFGPFHMAEKGIYPSVESLEYGMRLFNDTVLTVGKEENVPVVDAEKHVPKTLDYLFDDVHPTEKGLEIEAELVFKEIVRSKIIENWIAAGKPGPESSAVFNENRRV